MHDGTPPAARSAALWLPVVLLLVLGNLWGASFSIAKIAVENGVPPLGYAFWQAFGPAVLLLIVALVKGQRPLLDRRHLIYYLIAGQIGISIPNINFYVAIAHIPAGVMAVVVTLAPLLTYLFALLVKLERFRLQRAAGIALGLSGALLLVLPAASLPDPGMVPWVLLAFLTPAFYSASSIFAAKARPENSGSLGLACGMMFAAALVQLPLVAAAGDFYWPALTPGPADWAIGAQILLSSLAYVLFFEILRMASPVFFSQVAYVVTLTGLAWGAIFFAEHHSQWIYLATLLVLAGVAVVNLRRG